MPAVVAWVSGPMAELNRDIIARRRPAAEFPRRSPRRSRRCRRTRSGARRQEARRLVVLLGFAGAGLGRHFQERDPAHRRQPERAFDLTVGVESVPFLDYFARLAGTDRHRPPRTATRTPP